jgi:tetratricopeptide (TPR) repeat protein
MLKLGEVLYRGGKVEEGEAKIRDAIEFANSFANDYPDFSEFQVMAANAWDQVANLYQEFHPAEVPAAFEHAVAIRRELVRRFPDRAAYQGGLGGLLNDWANWLDRQERSGDACTLYAEAIDYQRNAIKLSPRAPTYRQYLRNHHVNLAKVHVRRGNYSAATAAIVDMLRDFPDATEQAAQVYRRIAWQLAASGQSDELQAKEALASAEAAIELAPRNAAAWQVLGWAHYRNAQYQKAIEALNKSMELQGGGDPGQWLFLAMSHWKLNASPHATNAEATPISAQADSGHADKARNYYESAVDWMGTNPLNDEFSRFRAEAEQLMGINPHNGQPPEP